MKSTEAEEWEYTLKVATYCSLMFNTDGNMSYPNYDHLCSILQVLDILNIIDFRSE